MLPKLYLMRHGQTDWNRDGRIQGQMESDLNETGRAQAVRQGEILQKLDVPKTLEVFCSPQRRTRQTAELALSGLGLAAPHFDERLKEIHCGRWEGFLYDEVTSKEPEFFEGKTRYDAIVDGPGEQHDDMSARLGAFLEDVTRPSLIISHGVALTYIRGLICGLTRLEMANLQREQGVVIELVDQTETVWR